MARAKSKTTLVIPREKLRPKTRAGVKPSRLHTPKKKYRRKPKHPQRGE